MALGGLGAMLLAGHSLASVQSLIAKVDIQSVFFATVFTIIILVLAYLTNPSETSFRTYLTEQSFKQHLSRLDDSGQDDESSYSDDSGVHFSLSRRSQSSGLKSRPNGDPFYFVSKASVSLRTPKHVFYSFGIFTLAAVYPTGRSLAQVRARGHATIQQHHDDPLGSLVSDAWFFGAFGKWWRGGVIYDWWHDLLARTKDAEKCSSGILDVKALDALEGFDGLPFCTPSSPLHHVPTVKLRGNERSLSSIPRSTTPPPLPKSALLPLHAPRVPTSPPKATGAPAPHPASVRPTLQVPTNSDYAASSNVAYSPSASSFDTSPVIAEVLRQIAQATANIHELRTQLGDFRTAATENHATIKLELESQRDRKRAEDAARLELKTRTKTLEESKRVADSGKRDAEKKLRVAESARDNAALRMERLDKEIGALRERMKDDADRARAREEAGDEEERKAHEEMERKRKEIKVAEDVVAALNSRAKELEEKIALEEERLKRAREAAELKKQDRSFNPLTVVSTADPADLPVPWSPITPYTSQGLVNAHDPVISHSITPDYQDRREVFPQPIQGPRSKGSSSSGSSGYGGSGRDVSESPRPARLSLTGISNLREPAHRIPDPDPNGQVLMRPRGFKFLADLPTSLSSSQSHCTRFSPFADSDYEFEFSPGSDPHSALATGLSRGLLSPVTSSLIPTSLIHSLDGSPALENGSNTTHHRASFQADDDTVLAPNWRKLLPADGPAPNFFTVSPTALTCPSFDGVDKDDPFEVRPPPLPLRRRITSELAHLQRAGLARAPSDVGPIGSAVDPAIVSKPDKAQHRRWYSAHTHDTSSAQPKRGLNPEAKVFSLTKKSLPTLASAPASFESATATAPAPDPPPAQALFASLSMRAFAPSAAERSALGTWATNNTSTERLPTLSEVTPLAPSIPSSPTHAHAHAHAHAQAVPAPAAPPGLSSLSWLQSLSAMRRPKVAFSPWEDEETGVGA